MIHSISEIEKLLKVKAFGPTKLDIDMIAERRMSRQFALSPKTIEVEAGF